MIFDHLLSKLFLASIALNSIASYAADNTRHSVDMKLLDHQTNPKIIAAMPEVFPPFYHVDEEGLPYGMAMEVMNEIDHHAGYLITYVIKKNWSEVFESIDSGEADIIPSLGITEERKNKYFFTAPYAVTEIAIFGRNDEHIKKDQLKDLKTGAVKNNIGTKVARLNGINNTIIFESIDDAFNALLNKNIDAIIYPRVIAKNDAHVMGITHLLNDTGIILSSVDRAIAVSKKFPEIYESLNASLIEYMKTQNYKDTYAAWYGEKPQKIQTSDLVIFNVLILLTSISVFIYIWKKRNFSLGIGQENKKTNVLWVLSVILVLITATTIITITTLFILYETSFNEQRQRLIDTTKSRARLIESVARYDFIESKKNTNQDLSARERTLGQIKSAHNKFSGFGNTGEFTMASKVGNNIEFILRQRHTTGNIPKVISFSSNLATPMRLALLGHSGTIIGKDYRGENVLAAYEPVRILNAGIVAKIDITEIREPFINSALYIFSIVILVSFFGALLLINIMIPVIKKIKDTEQRFHQLFRNNQSVALLINPKNGRIIDANEAAIVFYGYSLIELLTYNFSIFYPNDSSEMTQQLLQALNGEKTIFITKHRLQNGEIRDIEALTSPVMIDDNKILNCVITDITDQINKDAEYTQLQKELEQTRKMEALGQLTGGISHDFNNMLGIIMGYTSLAQDKLGQAQNSQIQNYLEQVQVASDRAKELISSMMLFSRTDEDKNEIIDITPLVKEDLKMLRSIIPTSIHMNYEISNNLPAVLIEPVKLQQLIMNLCVNARDAMDGKGSLDISLNLRKNVNEHCKICFDNIKGDWIELAVKDTGTGMSEEVMQHLFEPFFTTKEKGKGTGMGMSVVHGIVKNLGGHILLESTQDKGTTISILFQPIHKIIQKNSPINEIENSSVKGKRVLIVDDEESLAEMISDTLSFNHYECEAFSSPIIALSTFIDSPDKYDLIISDQTMPDLTGLDMVKKMRELKPNIPAIIATGFSESIDEIIAKENNIVLLRKPVSNNILLKNIKDIFTI